LEGLLLHEVPVLAIAVQVLHVGIHHVRRLDRVGALHGDFLHAPGLDQAVFDAGEGLALARLDVLGVGDDRGVAVDQDLHSVLDVVHAVAGHRYSCDRCGSRWADRAAAAARMGRIGLRRGRHGPGTTPGNRSGMIPAASLALKSAPAVAAPGDATGWKRLWREAVRDPRELLALLGLEGRVPGLSGAAAAQFPLRVPRGFVARMRHGDPHDPLLRQVLPLDDELRPVPGFSLDAVGDGAARAGHGVIHKYEGRALLVATGRCAVNCPYCFRRHFPYAEETAAAAGWREAVATIRADPSIHEVILSGGDPLSLATPK